MITREKAIANVLRDYSRAKDKGTRAAVVERVLRMREDRLRPDILAVLGRADFTSSEQIDAILRIARGES